MPNYTLYILAIHSGAQKAHLVENMCFDFSDIGFILMAFVMVQGNFLMF